MTNRPCCRPVQSLCDPDDGICYRPAEHTSGDCYPRYLALETDGTPHEIMDFYTWRATVTNNRALSELPGAHFHLS